MIKRQWYLLFSDFELDAVLRARLQTLNKKVYAIPEQRFEKESNEFMAAMVASQLVVSPLRMLEDKITVSSREASIDVSHDPLRCFATPGPHYVRGLEVTYHLPYMGEPKLLRCRPNPFTFNPPRAVIGSDELRFPYDQADRNIQATEADFQEDVTQLREWVSRVNAQVTAHNAFLEERARHLVERRRAEIDKTQSDLAQLGYPIRSNASVKSRPEVTAVVDKRRKKRLDAEREYDVALSFAGEDREYVERVAEVLDELEVSVFYDRFEEVNLWGKDLWEHLHAVYSKESRFVVVFVSRHSAKKVWPGHERRSALSRQVKGESGRILPVRLDDTSVPGIPSTMSYMDAQVLTPEKLANLIREKVDAP